MGFRLKGLGFQQELKLRHLELSLAHFKALHRKPDA